MSHVAIASCARLTPDGDPDDALLARACADIGVRTSVRDWSDPEVDWAEFDLTVIRSTWDYADRRTEFLDWVASTPRLRNGAEVVAANSDKLYLKTLAEAGIPIVPTAFFAPDAALNLDDVGEVVLKPSVGAGSRGAGRFDLSDAAGREAATRHGAELQAAGRTVLAQPYLSGVDSQGETALIFIAGLFSHAVVKGAMLPPRSRHRLSTESLYVSEQIAARDATGPERELAETVIGSLGESLLYARVDLLPTPDGPVVIELELTEPSLFLGFDADAPARLARAIAEQAR